MYMGSMLFNTPSMITNITRMQICICLVQTGIGPMHASIASMQVGIAFNPVSTKAKLVRSVPVNRTPANI
jgi:hypothetical protein